INKLIDKIKQSIMKKIILLLFLIHQFLHTQQRIVVIIPSFNNESCYKQNLDSVFFQDYSCFNVIYINDCSTDDTGNLVQQYIDDHQLHDHIILINNPHNQKAMANIYFAVHRCNDNDLIVILDGDDAFAHEQVLSTIQQIHHDRNAWVSYAQFINVP